jgi:putative ABC transport system ATP-binding protein
MLQIANLTKTYGSGEQAVQAVRHVSLVAQAGEFIAIIGPSGSGKTTLLAMTGGLLTPTEGTITVAGQDIARLSSSQLATFRRQSVGYVFQANNLLPFLTARENLLVIKAIGAGRGADKQRADQLLNELGLESRANAVATELSGGERQRVAIARALMNDPELVLVDEPTASLDSARGKQVVQLLIDETKARNKLAIMVTHDLDMAVMADRILEMRDGVLREHDGEAHQGHQEVDTP